MIIAFLIGLLGILIIANSRSTAERDVSPGCNAGLWLLAVVTFVVFLSVASVVAGALADPAILAGLDK